MPIPVSDIELLKIYLRGVLGKAKHHAPNVDEIVLALAGGIISRKNSVPLEVRKAPSGMGNVLSFVSTRGRKYTLSYDHATKEIVLKQGNTQGNVLHRFSNVTSLSQVAAIFASL